MPELPDVEGFRRTVEMHVGGARIVGVEVANATVLRGAEPADLDAALTGRTIEHVRRHGKWLLVDTDGPTLAMHFGMTGALRWQPGSGGGRPSDRVTIVTSSGMLVVSDRRNLGTVAVVPAGTSSEVVTGPLGPDALSIDVSDLSARLRSSRRSVKATLADQSVVAGLGNMLTDEVLWRAGIDPVRAARDLDEVEVVALRRAMRTALRDAVRAGHIPRGPTWLSGTRAAEVPACPRCGAPLLRRRLDGRTSLSCPHCQPALPAGTPDWRRWSGARVDHTARSR